MPRRINQLNATKVRNLKEPGRYLDGDGLYLEIGRTGSKAWTYKYHWLGKARQMGLGSVKLVSLADAREKAREAAKLRSVGIDPIAHYRASQEHTAVPTFGEAALEFISDREAGWKNAKHRQQWRNTLETYAAPIWNRPVDEVNVDDVLSILRTIWTSKPETAMRVRGRIEAVLSAAKVRGLRSGENPAVWRGNLELLLSRQRRGPKRHHRALPWQEAPGFFAKLHQAKGASARALELLIHTAVRTSEALNAEWKEIDLENGLWSIPADRMKAGKVHRVPLSRQVVHLLEALPRTGKFLFPGQKGGKPLSNMAMMMLLRRLGHHDFTVHGFRSTFRDWCSDEAGTQRELAEQALAHQVGNKTERAYARSDMLDRRRPLMQQWSDFLTSIELSDDGSTPH